MNKIFFCLILLSEAVFIPPTSGARRVSNAQAEKWDKLYKLAQRVHQDPSLLQSATIQEQMNYFHTHRYVPERGSVDDRNNRSIFGKYVPESEVKPLEEKYAKARNDWVTGNINVDNISYYRPKQPTLYDGYSRSSSRSGLTEILDRIEDYVNNIVNNDQIPSEQKQIMLQDMEVFLAQFIRVSKEERHKLQPKTNLKKARKWILG